jgi:hypothetical protein
MLADEFQKAKWEAGEQKLASELKLTIPKQGLSPDELQYWTRFSSWCEERSARKLPTRPTTLAAYVVAWQIWASPLTKLFPW